MQIWLHQLEAISLMQLSTSSPKNNRTPSCKTHGNTRAGELHKRHQLQHADYE
jgi:hypothetical protein